MKINEKRVARPPKATRLEIHFEGNLICCKWAKNILLHWVWRSCTVCPSALSVCVSVCRRVFVADEDAMLWIAQLRGGETLESVNNSSNSALFLHDCSPALLSRLIQLQDVQGELVKKLLGKNKVWPPLQVFACLLFVWCSAHVHTNDTRSYVTWNPHLEVRQYTAALFTWVRRKHTPVLWLRNGCYLFRV